MGNTAAGIACQFSAEEGKELRSMLCGWRRTSVMKAGFIYLTLTGNIMFFVKLG